MRSFTPRTSMGEPVKAVTKSYDGDELGPRVHMGDDVPAAVREDAEFQRLFRDSQAIKNSRRPADQKRLAEMLNQMRARWNALTGVGDA